VSETRLPSNESASSGPEPPGIGDDLELDPYDQVLRKTWDQQIPYRVLWELTYRCNERCRHCYIVERDGRGELATAEVCRVLDELAEAGTLFVTFTGGEVLLREDFFEIAAHARKKGFAFRLLTNGTLVTPELADRLMVLHPLSVEVSIYSTRPEIHDEITQVPGSHGRSLRALWLLHERGVQVKVKSPLMERSVEQFEELRALSEELGGGFTYDTTLVPADDGSEGPLLEAMRPETLRGFYSRYLSQWRPIVPTPDGRLCNSGLNIAAIDPYGNVHPCVQLRLVAGNLRQQRFPQIWRESPVMHRMRELVFAALRDCPGCELLPYCIRCPGVAYLETGDLLACSPVARMDATVRRGVVEEKGIVEPVAGPPPPCDEN
jgi:radical SAM protein with 4Fe4S-binding SPASM domain